MNCGIHEFCQVANFYSALYQFLYKAFYLFSYFLLLLFVNIFSSHFPLFSISVAEILISFERRKKKRKKEKKPVQFLIFFLQKFKFSGNFFKYSKKYKKTNELQSKILINGRKANGVPLSVSQNAYKYFTRKLLKSSTTVAHA